MRLLQRIRSREQLARDAGLSLVELLTAMALTSILLITCATLFIGSTKTAHGTQSRLEEINDGRVAIASMGRSMRTAILPSQLFYATSTDTSAFISADAQSLRFYANIDNPNNIIGPTKVTYAVAGGVLTQTTQIPNTFDPANPIYIYCTPGPTCPTKTKILSRNVVTSSPIFRYYDSLGTELVGAPQLNDDQLDSVDSVDVIVTVAKSGSGGGGSTFALRVAMPNHDAAMRANDEES
jgi:hypothetical protein